MKKDLLTEIMDIHERAIRDVQYKIMNHFADARKEVQKNYQMDLISPREYVKQLHDLSEQALNALDEYAPEKKKNRYQTEPKTMAS